MPLKLLVLFAFLFVGLFSCSQDKKTAPSSSNSGTNFVGGSGNAAPQPQAQSPQVNSAISNPVPQGTGDDDDDNGKLDGGGDKAICDQCNAQIKPMQYFEQEFMSIPGFGSFQLGQPKIYKLSDNSCVLIYEGKYQLIQQWIDTWGAQWGCDLETKLKKKGVPCDCRCGDTFGKIN